jgi:choline dehydrogenase-like flavoprotein
MHFFLDRCMELLEAADAKQRWALPDFGEDPSGVELLGTCRMGTDPKSSVIRPDHRAHDVPNLFLCDGSSFVSSGRGQPTLTILALAYRAADQIKELARRGQLGG